MATWVVTDAGWTQLGSAQLPSSGVTAGTYGDATHVGQFTVNAQGQVTAASDVAITGGGGGGGFVSLFDTTLTVAAPSIDTGAGGIAGGYAALHIAIVGRSDAAAFDDVLKLLFNNDTTAANYHYGIGLIFTGGPISQINAAAPGIVRVPGASQPAGMSTTATVDVPGYDGVTFQKTALGLGAYNSAQQTNTGMLQWLSTAAITRIAIAPTTGANLVAGSRMTIWGLT